MRGLLSAILLISLSLFSNNQLFATEPCATKPNASRLIGNSSFAIHPLWSRSISISQTVKNTFLLSIKDQLDAAHYCPDNETQSLTAFDWKTGQEMWAANVPTNIYDLTLDENRSIVYISEIGQIQGMSSNDGSILWTNRNRIFDRNGHPLQVLPNGKVIVYIDDLIKQVEPTNGDLLDFPLPSETFFFDGETAYIWGPIDQNRWLYNQAVDPKSGQVKWKSDTNLAHAYPSTVQFRPFVAEGLLIYRESGGQNTFVVIDKNTGNLLWKMEDYEEHSIISNIIISNGVLYALDHRARLLLYSARTGQQLGMVEFQRPNRNESDLLYQPGAIGGSELLIKDNRIAIYFQDSKTLSIYEFAPPTLEN